jgi:hypothetical protein
MRNREGQLSDNRPIQRTRAEKEKLFKELVEKLKDMKPHESPALRASIVERAKALKAELAEPAAPPREPREPREPRRPPRAPRA